MSILVALAFIIAIFFYIKSKVFRDLINNFAKDIPEALKKEAGKRKNT